MINSSLLPHVISVLFLILSFSCFSQQTIEKSSFNIEIGTSVTNTNYIQLQIASQSPTYSLGFYAKSAFRKKLNSLFYNQSNLHLSSLNYRSRIFTVSLPRKEFYRINYFLPYFGFGNLLGVKANKTINFGLGIEGGTFLKKSGEKAI